MPTERASWHEPPDHELPEVRSNLRRILLLSDIARCKADYEFLDKYIHRVNYFSDLPPRDRLRYLKAAKGIELEDGDALFRIGDRADAFYCIMYGTMSVVMDFARMAAPTLNEFEEIINRARVHSSFLNPGGKLDMSHDATYVVRTMKPLEVFGDVGLLLDEQQRTASVVATEKTLLLQIDRDTFLALRTCNLSRELREKMTFLAGVTCLDHWEDDGILKLCDRMEKIHHTYNDVVVAEGEPANHFYFVKHGECRLVKRYPTLEYESQPCFVEVSTVGSQHYFGFYEPALGMANAFFSVLVSSPSAIFYRVDRVDFRQIMLKDVTTEQAMRAEVTALSARADMANVVRDLQHEVTWRQYKRALVGAILTRHEEEHVPIMGPRPNLGGHRTARDPSSRLPKLRLSPSPRRGGVQTARSVPKPPGSGQLRPLQRPRGTRLGLSPRRAPGGNWVKWAKERVEDSSSTTNLDRQRDAQEEGEQTTGSNIKWGKTSQVMGGLQHDEDKVSSAIVSLFNRKDGGK